MSGVLWDNKISTVKLTMIILSFNDAGLLNRLLIEKTYQHFSDNA